MTEPTLPMDATPAPKETLSEADKFALERAQMRLRLAQANAEKALAQSETAEMFYKHTIMQIYMRYQMTEEDALDSEGKILRGGNKKKEDNGTH